jgi:hypothetical protein
MPVAGGDGSGIRKTPPRKGDNQIVRHNPVTLGSTGPAAQPAAPATAPASNPAGGGNKVLGGTKAATKATDPYAKATAAAAKAAAKLKADERKEKRLIRDRYIEDAERLGGQVAALRAALGKDGAFRNALDTKLGNLEESREEQLGALEKGFGERWGSLAADERNNEISASDASATNEGNLGRERTMALAEAAAQGAGESDQLRTQLMSLRSWDNNQNEVNRAYHDSARGIQNSRIDLVGDTRTAMQNVWYEADADKQQLWNDFHAQQSESYTALGNALGQQAEYYGLAKSQGTGGKVRLSMSAQAGARGGRGGRGGRPDEGNNLSVGQFQGGESNVADYDFGDRSDYSPGTHGVLGGAGFEFKPKTGQLGEPEDNREGKKRGKGKGKSKTNGFRDKRVSLAKAMDVSEEQSDQAFMQATNQIGIAYDSNGMPYKLKTWGDGKVPETKPLNNSLLPAARTTIATQRPEGATLRSW